MISKEEVEHIAKLARLDLTEDEIKKMQKNLTEILDYFKLLKNVPGTKIKGAKVAKSNLRIDETVDSKITEELINNSPDRKDGYIKVKAIF
jgi:aspartyl-tRNA(Asn)/glutamyl-tRNA(Gln) amidotransferase subunit C